MVVVGGIGSTRILIKNVQLLYSLSAKYKDGVILGIFTNEELKEYLASLNLETAKVSAVTDKGVVMQGQLAKYLLFMNGNILKAVFPEYEQHVSKRRRAKEAKLLPDKIEQSIELNMLLDEITTASNPGSSIDTSMYGIGTDYRSKTVQSNRLIIAGAYIMIVTSFLLYMLMEKAP